MEERKEVEWAWAAGLFEGEGTIVFRAKNSVEVQVHSTDRDVLERLDSLAPSKSGVKSIKTPAGRKQLYGWSIGNRDGVRNFLLNVVPWLGQRRTTRANEALERLAQNRGAKGNQMHCIRGHPLSGNNLVITTKGSRNCRTCNRERAAGRLT